jgi:hypothetical protein
MIQSSSETASQSTKASLGEAGYDLFRVDHASPMVAVLAHEDCPVTGELFSTLLGRISNVFVGVTDGVEPQHLTPESIMSHMGQIMDRSSFITPRVNGDHYSRILALRKAELEQASEGRS